MANLEEANSVKPEKFSGHNFRRWQKQVKYWLTVLGLISALEESQPSTESSSWLNPEQIEYHSYNRILSALSDHLYDVYHATTSTAKELWQALEAEYGIVDAGIDRFTVSNFNGYKMVENKSVGEQIHEYQELLRGVEKKGTKFSEDFKVSCLIDKLPPSWDEFARTLRHKQGEVTLVQVINSLRVEEKHRSSQKKETEKPPTVNLVENNSNKNKDNKSKFNTRNNKKNFQPRRRNFKDRQTNQNRNFEKTKNQERERICFVCGRTNHVAKDCFHKKTEVYRSKSNHNVSRAQVHMLVEQEPSQTNFKYDSLVNFTYQNKDWWLDSGANIHVCFDRGFFKNYHKSSGGSVTLGNDTVAQVLGIGDIELKKTSRKVLVLKEVRHVPDSVERNTQLLELIHSDVCDSNRPPTRAGNKYFVTFIDDCSKYCYIYLIKTKDEVFNKFKVYKNEVENQLERRIKRLRSDRGGEYTLNDLSVFCEEHGIIHQVTAPYSPQSNGVAERKNMTLLDMVNAMLLSSGLPDNLWGEAILTACFILNRVIVKDNTTTPYEVWKKRAPNLQVLKVWGCLAKVAIPEPKRKKIGPKTVDSVFLGYAHNSSANRFLVINSEISEISNNTILESRDATYFEDIFPFKTRIQKQVVDRSRSNNGSDKASTSTSLPVVNEAEPLAEPRRSNRPRVEKSFGDDFYTFLVEGDPTTYREAMISIDAPFWKEAINSEIESILQNNTWELTDLPPGTTPIGCKWVFRKKLKPDGSIDKYKARLVAKGFTQKKGIDYFDTYSPVSRITTIRTLIGLAFIHNLVVHQMDVKTSFLNGDLDEEIYMEQPEGFIVKGQEHKVCMLVKSLYGLKQAPKQWHEKFDKVILEYDFKINEHDKCVYYKECDGDCVILCLYVDDILLFGTNMKIVKDVKSYLSRKFDMKDLGEAYIILGMKLEKTQAGFTLDQSSSIEKMLKKFNSLPSSPAS
ncbi:unnamed protein product [Prunus armeniaca]